MARWKTPTLSRTTAELAALFADPHRAARFPPILNVEQTADLLQVPKHMVYAWSSQGVLDGCAQRVGKHLCLNRNRLVQFYT